METPRPMKEDGALCARREYDPELWFSGLPAAVNAAKNICDKCKLKEQCLDYALENPDIATHGMYGGMSEEELRKLRRMQEERAG